MTRSDCSEMAICYISFFYTQHLLSHALVSYTKLCINSIQCYGTCVCKACHSCIWFHFGKNNDQNVPSAVLGDKRESSFFEPTKGQGEKKKRKKTGTSDWKYRETISRDSSRRFQQTQKKQLEFPTGSTTGHGKATYTSQ